MKFLIGLFALATVSHALTVTKTYSGASPVTVDGTADYAVQLDAVTFSSADFYAGATITKVTASIDWTKTDGSCSNQTSGNAYHNETNFRLDAPIGNVVLAKESTWSGDTDIGTVTTVFDQGAGSIPSGTPSSGTFKPNDGNLDTYIGGNPVGDWSLSAGDSAGWDPLCIYSYSISITVPDVPMMNITKGSMVISDPVNNTTNPKRIPGAVIRYCFTVDNNGTGAADSVEVHDFLTGDGKDSLTYVKSGSMIQDISVSCDCTSSSMDDSKGSYDSATKEVAIDIGTLTGSEAPDTSRGCAYIETTIN